MSECLCIGDRVPVSVSVHACVHAYARTHAFNVSVCVRVCVCDVSCNLYRCRPKAFHFDAKAHTNTHIHTTRTHMAGSMDPDLEPKGMRVCDCVNT